MKDEVLDRLIWAAREWFQGWKPDPYISDRRDRELYEAIKAMLIRDALEEDSGAVRRLDDAG